MSNKTLKHKEDRLFILKCFFFSIDAKPLGIKNAMSAMRKNINVTRCKNFKLKKEKTVIFFNYKK